jgi:hypothetical protein
VPQSARSTRALAREVAALRAEIDQYRAELRDVVEQLLDGIAAPVPQAIHRREGAAATDNSVPICWVLDSTSA